MILHSHANKSHFTRKALQVRVFGTLVKVCDSRKFPGCEFELRIQVQKGKWILTNIVMQRSRQGKTWFTHQSRFCFLFRAAFPFVIIKTCWLKNSIDFFLVSSFLCSFRINLELFKAGDAMSSPAIVSLTELTHTFLLFETGNCCKNFNVTSCLKKVKNFRKLCRNPGVTLVLRLSLHFICKSKRII